MTSQDEDIVGQLRVHNKIYVHSVYQFTSGIGLFFLFRIDNVLELLLYHDHVSA